jgi:BlaI family transcriptional regulator, penicillinase repressor
MSNEPLAAVSEAELHVLRALWECGPSGVREIHAYLRDAGQQWARTTVVTLLQRLVSKGYVETDKSEHAFCYRPAVTRDEMLHFRMSELADELCDGQWAPLLLTFAERGRLAPQDVAELRQLVDDLARRAARAEKKRK